MGSEKFLDDLQKVHEELKRMDQALYDFYDLLEGKENKQARDVVELLIRLVGLEVNDQTRMAAITRIVSLREDALGVQMQKAGFDNNRIRRAKEIAYGYVSHFHLERFEKLHAFMEQNGLLSPFYRALITGAHLVGLAMTAWQGRWMRTIIYGVNEELSRMFEGDEAKVLAMLAQNDLLDCDTSGKVSDRCYSALIKEASGKYDAKAYAEVFEGDVQAVVGALKKLIDSLAPYEDSVFGKKREWIGYIEALIEAFSECDRAEAIEKWGNVDRAWMQIDTPIQIGHPLEYYEDRYRKAVALEWDVRILNPALQERLDVRESIKAFFEPMANRLGAHTICQNNLAQIERTQLYVGRPLAYYGAEFNGLFSAQVVPNDETVSSELGKKIFAYADFVLESQRRKPIMALSLETFGEAFVRKRRDFLEKAPQTWLEVYAISTIGHEYGHILWMDQESEAVMNQSGAFKLIEEFKATTGGLMAFFAQEKEDLIEAVTDDLISRAVGLMAWREVDEVLPYYTEGLIHLELLFASGVIVLKDGIFIEYDRYEAMKRLYLETYEALARHYIAKEDALRFLERYVRKDQGVYLPRTPQVCDFVEHYYGRYKEIGQQTATL